MKHSDETGRATAGTRWRRPYLLMQSRCRVSRKKAKHEQSVALSSCSDGWRPQTTPSIHGCSPGKASACCNPAAVTLTWWFHQQLKLSSDVDAKACAVAAQCNKDLVVHSGDPLVIPSTVPFPACLLASHTGPRSAHVIKAMFYIRPARCGECQRAMWRRRQIVFTNC